MSLAALLLQFALVSVNRCERALCLAAAQAAAAATRR
jgi:hypothetical protein